MKFGGSKYADRDTIEKLCIADDVDEMFNNLGIGAFMYKRHESYRKASCLLLATLDVHLCAAGKYTTDGSDGYICFWATGRRQHLSFRQIDRALCLPPSNRHGLDVDRDQMTTLWGTIAFGDYLSSTAKSSHIRTPPIRYFYTAIANILVSRHATMNITENEMSMIAVALTGIQLRLNNGTQLRGSRAHGGVTCAVVDQLQSYQSWATRHRGIRHKSELQMGGLITPLLFAVGFAPDMTEDVAPPEELDLDYLKNSSFLQKTPADGPLL
ncbi:unnamed protein product [Microthlaspi erraticum]|uniref:Arabidopsis retrotransposon Orf1 C-terminal domain-containing protein n=1 Tax=Microthlaspi erraticum TaxID=1685480 RepID=A0A6D2JPS4_9BRAS|nr:unnamed protein product [Microthlaspi erraticum]